MASSNGNISALLALCAGNSPVAGEFSAQRPATRSFDVCFDLRLDKRLSKQSKRRWFETPLRSLWRHCNGLCSPRSMAPYDVIRSRSRLEQHITWWRIAIGTLSFFVTNHALQDSRLRTSHVKYKYRQISYISRTKFQNLNDSRLVLQLLLRNPLMTGVKSRLKM